MGVMLIVLACMAVIPVAFVTLVVLLVVYARRWSAWKAANPDCAKDGGR